MSAAARLVLVLVASLAPAALALDAPGVVVDELRLTDGATEVRYHLTGAFDEETIERLHSGLEISFRHRVELLAPRRWVLFRMLGRRVAAEASLETRVSYDAVTESYALLRERAGEPERRATDSFDEVRAFMTRPEPIELRHDLGAAARDRLLVNIEVVVGRRYLAWLIPAPRTLRERRPLAP